MYVCVFLTQYNTIKHNKIIKIKYTAVYMLYNDHVKIDCKKAILYSYDSTNQNTGDITATQQ